MRRLAGVIELRRPVMHRGLITILAVSFVVACAPSEAPETGADAARAQADLATDSTQARLWGEAAATGSAEQLQDLHIEGQAVRKGDAKPISDRRVETKRVNIPESVDAAMILLEVPDLDEPFSGKARVTSANGQFVVLDLGNDRSLAVQVKVRKGPLSVRSGEEVDLYLQRGEVFHRSDILTLKAREDELIYALVGGEEPVRFQTPDGRIRAMQTGRPEGNSTAVTVASGGETQQLRAGEQADFKTSHLTVKVLSSVAVQGSAAHALEEPYRLALMAWRTVQE
jgi:hypothetical protein